MGYSPWGHKESDMTNTTFFPHENLYTGVFGSFIHNCQDLETTVSFSSTSMDISIVVHPYNEILLTTKNK